MALGANRADVVKLVIREAALLLGIGLVIGGLLSLATVRAATSLLYGLQPNDPATLLAATLFLALVAIAASLLPALRAARIEPLAALRDE